MSGELLANRIKWEALDIYLETGSIELATTAIRGAEQAPDEEVA